MKISGKILIKNSSVMSVQKLPTLPLVVWNNTRGVNIHSGSVPAVPRASKVVSSEVGAPRRRGARTT